MKSLLSVVFVALSLSVAAQNVVLFENFEGTINGWSKSITEENLSDNEWFIISGLSSSLSSGVRCIAVSGNNGATNMYNNVTSDHSAYITPNWPADPASHDINLRYDVRCQGTVVLGIEVDYLRVFLVDMAQITSPDPPTVSNLNVSNSIELRDYAAEGANWFRESYPLTTAQKNFIASSPGNVAVVFNWVNNNVTRVNPPAAIDNVTIISTPNTPQPLNGTYEVGKITNNDFLTISSAVSYLNTYGLSGNVEFLLTDETYDAYFETLPYVIGNGTATPFTGAGTHNITFKPAIGITPEVTGSGYITDRGLFNINAVSNITIDGSNVVGGTSRDLTIFANDASANNRVAVLIGARDEINAISNITVKNSILRSNSATQGYGVIAAHYTNLTEGRFNNIYITNNEFYTGREAIHIDGLDRDGGGGYTTNSRATNIFTENNIINGAGANAIRERGIHYLGVDNGTISNNVVGNLLSTDDFNDFGIMVDKNSKNITVAANEVFNITYTGSTTNAFSGHGIGVNSGLTNANVILKNNVIHGISGYGSSATTPGSILSNPAAILLGIGGQTGTNLTYTQSGYEIYNNSISLYGDALRHVQATSFGVAVANNTVGVSLESNVIRNTLGGNSSLSGRARAIGVYGQSASGQFSTIDYNNHFINAGTTRTFNYIGAFGAYSNLNTNATTTMANWRTATAGREASSIAADPGYTSTSNLVPDVTNSNSWNIHGMAKHNAKVADDFNGVARPASVSDGTPDMGAYEFELTRGGASTPPVVNIAGPLTTATPYTFLVNQRSWITITFLPGSDIPSNLALRMFSGDWPANPIDYSISNFYFELVDTFAGTPNYNFTMIMHYDDAYLGTVGDPGLVTTMISSSPDGSEWSSGVAVHNDAANTVTLAGLSNFGFFTMSSNINPLPVELIRFGGKQEKDHLVFEWATASEINNAGFIIQRYVAETKSWIDIGKVAGNGTVPDRSDYEFIDERPMSGSHIYRLLQEDYDGAINEAAITTVDFIHSDPIHVYPNPAHAELNIVNQHAEEAYIQILSTKGNIVTEKIIPPYQKTALDVSSLAQGIYVLKVQMSSFSYQQSFSKMD
ncbi:T9SS type A sorting domain-containing protein [Fulvivirga maritima]|uniref:T9SS type A sorting domain-containing protein n=1 Tax=Fulvivirga maritima TaxID=2904247 RepID=UPI001F48894D|nr:T9SS type A sorting domain-containing protein [Fulvivirga maritima]UII26837.1 T9SS type A sorting domain-containing protein [Fulvivirga maritima]